MERTPVESSNIKSIGYDPEREILEIEFSKKGNIYEYFNVPEDIYNEMMKAESKGKFLHQVIIPNFHYEKLV